MASKFYKNAILVGCIDWCCLVCEKLMKSEVEATEHLAEPVHKRTLSVFEKYWDDQILKVKLGYYCTCCNMIFPTAAIVTLHVQESLHKKNKGIELLTRQGDTISYSGVLIQEDAWNGITGGMCAVCNVEFDEEIAHKKEYTHILNLAKTSIEFGLKKAIYRKIDDTIFQCITCNTVLPLDVQDTHFKDKNHTKLLLKGENAYQDLKHKQVEQTNVENDDNLNINELGKSENANVTTSQNTCAMEENKSEILESVSLFEKNEVNINFETETAMCKKCSGNVDFNRKSIENHIEEHKRNPSKRDVGYVPHPCTVDLKNSARKDLTSTKHDKKMLAITSTSNDNGVEMTTKSATKPVVDENHNLSNASDCSNRAKNENDTERTASIDEDLQSFAKENHLTFNRGNTNAYCRICETRLPASLRSMKEHITGNAHKKNLAKERGTSSQTSSKPENSRMLMDYYVDEVVNLRGLLLVENETVVNEKFCISTLSFHLVSKIVIGVGDRLRCQVCESNLTRYDFDRHVEADSHDLALKQTQVVTSFDTEFVREFRGLFHCGYCNLLEDSMEKLTAHLQSSQHKERKRLCLMSLRSHMPAIEAHKRERTKAILMRMMFGRHPFF